MKLLVFVLALFLAACASIPLAVPEKNLAARFDLKKGTSWQERALCTLRLRKPCIPGDETDRPKEKEENFKKFLALLKDSTTRPFREFRETANGFSFIEETKEKIVDAVEEKPDSPPGRIAYKIHDCWFVVYSRDEKGLYTKDENRALLSSLTIFCDREN